MGKTLGEMTPDERRAAIKRAAERFQQELTANAERIGETLDSVTDEPTDTEGLTVECTGCHVESVLGVAVVAAAHQCAKRWKVGK